MKAMLLAAGFGSRLRPLTADRPKVMVDLGGRPIIEYTIQRLRQAGIRELIINLHHRPEAVTDRLGDGRAYGVSIQYSWEHDLMGTAGAVAHAAELLGNSRFLVVYADNLVECDLAAFLAVHERTQAMMTMAVHRRADVTSSGVADVDPAGWITRFVEKPMQATPDASGGNWVNAGLYACQPEVLGRIPSGVPSDFGREVIPAMLAAGDRIAAYPMHPPERLLWIDTAEDLARTARLIAAAASP